MWTGMDSHHKPIYKNTLAGLRGFEPLSTVLETAMLDHCTKDPEGNDHSPEQPLLN